MKKGKRKKEKKKKRKKIEKKKKKKKKEKKEKKEKKKKKKNLFSDFVKLSFCFLLENEIKNEKKAKVFIERFCLFYISKFGNLKIEQNY